MTRSLGIALLVGATLSSALVMAPHAQAPLPAVDSRSARSLEPTNHPVLPRDLSQLWLAPENGRPAARPPALAAALALFDKGEYAKALPQLVLPAARKSSLGSYAAYYSGVAELGLDRPADARRTFQALLAQRPVGYLSEAAALGEASAAETLGDYAAAMAIYERLAKQKTDAPADLVMRLGGAARAAGDKVRAAAAFERVYYQFPTSQEATTAYSELRTLTPSFLKIAAGTERYTQELARAERLYSSRLYAPARAAFQSLEPLATGDDRQLVTLRIAESQYFLKRFREARDGVRPFIGRGARQAEALFFYAVSSGDLGDRATYRRIVRQLADEFPKESWSAEALNSLATYHILRDEDEEADAALRELYANNPRGPHAERAAWKVGWRAYRAARFADTVKYFDQAASDFPRSDYRPSWLYWSGRAHQRLQNRELAEARLTLTAHDYLNSYYGRLAVEAMNGRTPPPRVVGSDGATSVQAPPPPNETLVRALLDAQRYDEAVNELRYAQRTSGDSPAIQATLAWVFRQQGESRTGRQQFDLLRGSINTMRRAYPQFMAAGGELLPREVLSMIFPLSYWDLIQKHSTARGLDPYLVAALVAQESTFVPDIRSHANAVGLMQLMSFTARDVARRIGLRYSSALLTNPEANVRMGTTYFADKIKEFGGVHLALASYNAGEGAVRQWITERRNITDRAEFIDDIPYPETQTYVKRILGTRDDYHRLYSR